MTARANTAVPALVSAALRDHIWSIRSCARLAARERILSTAKNLFAQQGFHPTSIRDIAVAARVTSLLLYYYFGDKSGLRRAVLEDAADRVYALLQDARRSRGSSEDVGQAVRSATHGRGVCAVFDPVGAST